MATDLIERLAAYRPTLDEAIESHLTTRQMQHARRPGSIRVLAALAAFGLIAAGGAALAWTRADQRASPSSFLVSDDPVATDTDMNPVTTPTSSTTEAIDAPRATDQAVSAAVIERLAVGDSVMLGAAGTLVQSGFVVDAVESRQLRDGVEVIESLQQQGRLGQIVVVHLGSNGTIDESAITKLMDSLADVSQVVLLTSDMPREWTAGNNSLIYDAANDYPNVMVLDWAGLKDACPGDCFASDGFHLRPDGQRYYAVLIDGVTSGTYVVQTGDSPNLVAQKFCTTVSELVAANGWTSANDFPFPDDRINLPSPADDSACPDPAG